MLWKKKKKDRLEKALRKSKKSESWLLQYILNRFISFLILFFSWQQWCPVRDSRACRSVKQTNKITKTIIVMIRRKCVLIVFTQLFVNNIQRTNIMGQKRVFVYIKNVT